MNCKLKNGKRVDLDQSCNKEELDSIKLILNKSATAQQAARPESLPDHMVDYESMDERQVVLMKRKGEIFHKAALVALAEVQFLERDWWESMVSKYGLPAGRPVMVDMETGRFYMMVKKEENG